MRRQGIQVSMRVARGAVHATQGMQVGFLGQEDRLEEGIATHSSILAWEIPWTEEPGEFIFNEKGHL